VDSAVAAGGLASLPKCSTHGRQLLGAKGHNPAAFAHLAQVQNKWPLQPCFHPWFDADLLLGVLPYTVLCRRV
jgi:hypothetical protein